MPHNILQPLALVDYLGPGRDEKKNNKMIRQLESLENALDIAPYCHFKRLWHFVYCNQQSYVRIFSQFL